jgi:hypothetical protein
MTMPAYFGAMSMWFTLKPPRDSPSVPIVSVVASTPLIMPEASGIDITATVADSMPASHTDSGGGISTKVCVGWNKVVQSTMQMRYRTAGNGERGLYLLLM